MTSAKVSRSVVRSVLSIEQSEGVGAKVRRSIGTSQCPNLTPFLMLDNFKVAEGAGFPDHPHRGMTTLTYMIKGEFEHEDFIGHKGKIGPGDLQFMIAGKGIMHSEMPIHKPGGDDPFGLQLWIDLPKQHKMTPPSYQELKAAEIPSANPTPNVLVKVICGESDGNSEQGVVKSPVRPLGGCWFFDYQFTAKGEKVFQRIPKGWNSFIYTLEGEILVGGGQKSIKPFHTSILTADENETGVELESASDFARFVVVAGEPLDQEIVQHGPFLMDTKAGIQKAFMDYQMGMNGFEGAAGWRSEIGKKMRA